MTKIENLNTWSGPIDFRSHIKPEKKNSFEYTYTYLYIILIILVIEFA